MVSFMVLVNTNSLMSSKNMKESGFKIKLKEKALKKFNKVKYKLEVFLKKDKLMAKDLKNGKIIKVFIYTEENYWIVKLMGLVSISGQTVDTILVILLIHKCTEMEKCHGLRVMVYAVFIKAKC